MRVNEATVNSLPQLVGELAFQSFDIAFARQQPTAGSGTHAPCRLFTKDRAQVTVGPGELTV